MGGAAAEWSQASHLRTSHTLLIIKVWLGGASQATPLSAYLRVDRTIHLRTQNVQESF